MKFGWFSANTLLVAIGGILLGIGFTKAVGADDDLDALAEIIEDLGEELAE